MQAETNSGIRGGATTDETYRASRRGFSVRNGRSSAMKSQTLRAKGFWQLCHGA
jgi:hypothetical protein